MPKLWPNDRFAQVALSSVMLLASTACGDDFSGVATGSTCPEESSLTYDNFGQAFIVSNCLSCHTNKEEPTLTSLAAVQANRAKIDELAAAGPNAVNTAMPEGASITTEERTKLGEWLACGAP